MISVPSDLVTTGAITGRMAGMTVTLANPKANKMAKLGTEIKAALYNTQETEFKLCSFDVAQEELVIIAVYNSAEYCRFEGIAPDALATEGGKFVLLGSSANGTDAHSMLAKRFGIQRADSKTLGLSLAYGSGQVSCCNLLRPALGAKYNDKQLKALVTDYIRYFKGFRARGDYLWQDGLFSHFFNYAQWLISQPVPRLQFGSQAITNTLRPQNCGTDFHTSRMNWGVQATGSYILDYLGYEIDKGIFEAGLENFIWYASSVHDELNYICHDSCVQEWATIARKAYKVVWAKFFASFRMTCPQQVFDNLELTCDWVYRKSPTTPLATASGKFFFSDLKVGDYTTPKAYEYGPF
jgi:hypothetical protein